VPGSGLTKTTCGCGAALADGDCLCPATPLAKLIGRRYALGLLSLIANRGTIRFTELRNRLGDVSSSTVAARLSDLEAARLISRTVYPETPPRVEYSLTPRGREFCSILTDFLRRGPGAGAQRPPSTR
jgi:DNA-binding HxlR family transcriptional regulator